MRGKKLRSIVFTRLNRAQRVLDSTFDYAAQWALSGSGISTSAVAAGVLTMASTTTSYAVTPKLSSVRLEPGVYSVVYTISGYVSGGISICSSGLPDLSSPTDGTAQTGNGTFTESLTLTSPGYIGLRGRSGTISAMTIDNFTVTRTA